MDPVQPSAVDVNPDPDGPHTATCVFETCDAPTCAATGCEYDTARPLGRGGRRSPDRWLPAALPPAPSPRPDAPPS